MDIQQLEFRGSGTVHARKSMTQSRDSGPEWLQSMISATSPVIDFFDSEQINYFKYLFVSIRKPLTTNRSSRLFNLPPKRLASSLKTQPFVGLVNAFTTEIRSLSTSIVTRRQLVCPRTQNLQNKNSENVDIDLIAASLHSVQYVPLTNIIM